MERDNKIRELYYVDGSTVRKRQASAAPAPRRRPETERPARRPATKTYRSAAIRAEKSLYFSKGYALVMILAVLIMIGSCSFMLMIQNKVSEQERNISSMQLQIQDMEANNAAYEDSLESKYSLDKIYEVATKDLGMVYSQKGQIVYYQSANEDYVKQLKDVPEAK